MKLKIYGVHVHFFLCKLIYKHWSGLPGCFLRKSVNYYCLYPGNLLTILNTMEKPILLQSPAKGVMRNIFLRLFNWSKTSKIPYLWLKTAQNSANPHKGRGFLFFLLRNKAIPPPRPPKQDNKTVESPSWFLPTHRREGWESLAINL